MVINSSQSRKGYFPSKNESPSSTIIRKSEDVSVMGPRLPEKAGFLCFVFLYSEKGLTTLLRTSIKPLWQEEGSETAPPTPEPTQSKLLEGEEQKGQGSIT